MHGVNRKSQSFGFQQRALEVHPFFKAGNVNELWRPASLRVWASQKSMLERRKYLLTKQSVWQSCWHFPRSSGHHKKLTGSNVKMSIRRFYGLYISSSIKAGNLSVFSPPSPTSPLCLDKQCRSPSRSWKRPMECFLLVCAHLRMILYYSFECLNFRIFD